MRERGHQVLAVKAVHDPTVSGNGIGKVLCGKEGHVILIGLYLQLSPHRLVCDTDITKVRKSPSLKLG